MKKLTFIITLFFGLNLFAENNEKPLSTDEFADSFWQSVEETEIRIIPIEIAIVIIAILIIRPETLLL